MADRIARLADTLAELGREVRAAARAGDAARVATLDAARRTIVQELAGTEGGARAVIAQALAAEIAADAAAITEVMADMRRLRQVRAARRRYRAGNQPGGLAAAGQAG